jgi:hypothetical protein
MKRGLFSVLIPVAVAGCSEPEEAASEPRAATVQAPSEETVVELVAETHDRSAEVLD